MAHTGGSAELLCIYQPYLDLGPPVAQSQKAVTDWVIASSETPLTAVMMSIQHLHRMNKC